MQSAVLSQAVVPGTTISPVPVYVMDQMKCAATVLWNQDVVWLAEVVMKIFFFHFVKGITH